MCGSKRHPTLSVVRSGALRRGLILNSDVLCYELIGDECHVLVTYMIGFSHTGGIGKVSFVETVRESNFGVSLRVRKKYC